MYSIGDIARLGGVSARMLRHYDEIGLFHPAAVDPNGYRRYHPAQLVRLHRIVALRDLGFGLDTIAELVGGDISPEKLWGMLRVRQAELEAERSVLEGRLQRLSRHLVRFDRTVQGGTPMAELAVTTKTLDGVRVAELSSISPTFDPSDIGPTLSPLYPQLLERVAAAGVKLSGVPLAYYEDEPDGGGIIVHAAAPIPSDVTAIDGVAVVDLEPVDQAVCCLHLGDMSSVDDTVMAMLEWIADHGLQTIGYTRESYLACPDDRASWITEIQLPVTKDTSPAPSQPTWPARQPGC